MRRELAVRFTLLVTTFIGALMAGDSFRFATASDYFASSGDGQAPAVDQGAMAQPLDAQCAAPDDEFDCCFKACEFPCVYFQADVLYWDRIGTGCNEVLVTNANSGDTLLSTGNLDFNSEPGARFVLGWQPECCSQCCAFELGYWGIFSWNSNTTVRGSGDLAIPGDLGLGSNNFFLADVLGVNYRSDLHNVEVNCIKSCCIGSCCTGHKQLDFICGFRYLTLNDRLTLTATDLQEGTSSYDVNVRNNLYGIQLGGRLTRPLGCYWGLQLSGKAGLFYNDVTNSQVATDFPNTPSAFVLRNAASDRDGVAMLSEINAVLIRPINDNWNLRLGYSVFGLGGVALAGDQLDFTNTATSGTAINNTGWIFAHGALAGLERQW